MMALPILPLEITIVIIQHACQQSLIKESVIAQLSLYFSFQIRSIRFKTIDFNSQNLLNYLQWCNVNNIKINLSKLIKNIKISNQIIPQCMTTFKYNLDSLVFKGSFDKVGHDALKSIKTVKMVELDCSELHLGRLSRNALKSVKQVKFHLTYHPERNYGILSLLKFLDAYTNATNLEFFYDIYQDPETEESSVYRSTSQLEELIIKFGYRSDVLIDSILFSSHASLTKLELLHVESTGNLSFWINLKAFKSLIILNVEAGYRDDLDMFFNLNYILQGISDLTNLKHLTIYNAYIGMTDILLFKNFLLNSSSDGRCLNITMEYDYENQKPDYVQTMMNEVRNTMKGTLRDCVPVYHITPYYEDSDEELEGVSENGSDSSNGNSELEILELLRQLDDSDSSSN